MTINETIYPKGCYFIDDIHERPDFKTPYHIIKRQLVNKDLTYFSMMDNFINKQENASKRRGADLPYIGESYFSDKKGTRVMMVTQNSDAPRAGSIVFLGPLLAENYTDEEYRIVKGKCNSFLKPSQFHAGSYRHAVETLAYWNIDVQFLYLTDARKVHHLNEEGYDEQMSIDLIENEIDAVAPDILVPAGDVAYNFLRNLTQDQISTANGEVVFHVRGVPVVRAPFFTGRGRQGNFQDKSDRTKATLESLLKNY